MGGLRRRSLPHLVQNVKNSGKQLFYVGTPVAKNRLNFSEDLFFGEHLLIWTEKPIDFSCKTQCIKSFFGQKFGAPKSYWAPTAMVSEKIKTWYFPYSAFWLIGQWGKGYSPPAPPWLRYWMEHFFSPNSGGDLGSDAHQSQNIGGYADVDHTQIIGGDTVKLLGGYIPPGFRHPCSVIWL